MTDNLATFICRLSWNLGASTSRGRGCSFGIATPYGLDGPGIESWRGRDIPHLPDLPGGPPSLLYNGYRVFPEGGKAARGWRWPPTPSVAEVKERVELYLYSTSGASCSVLGWTLPLRLWLSDVLWGNVVSLKLPENSVNEHRNA